MNPVHELSIPLAFDGPQPAYFGGPRATAVALEAGPFTGSVARGGSCECATLTLTPHCNGTHTETARHLTGRGPAPFQALDALSYIARVATVTPVARTETADQTAPATQANDLLITEIALRAALDADGPQAPDASALIVRTLPNDLGKRTADWSKRQAPFFTREAVELIIRRGFMHLLYDGPSIDRTHDQGRLVAHRTFFGLPLAGRADPTRPDATVTEMIYVPDAVDDGFYELGLHVPPFDTDAAPSRVLVRRLPR